MVASGLTVVQCYNLSNLTFRWDVTRWEQRISHDLDVACEISINDSWDNY